MVSRGVQISGMVKTLTGGYVIKYNREEKDGGPIDIDL